MTLRKSLVLGTALLAGVFALGACSDDSSSPNKAPSGDPSADGSSNSNGNNQPGNGAAVSTRLSCSEIMFHGKDSLEWVEFYISSGEALKSMQTSELRLSGAVDLDFPNEPLAVGEYIVATNDKAMFAKNYPNFKGRLYQWNAGQRLSNSGDVVSVKLRGEGDVDCSFDNDPPWPSLADGKGHSLVYIGKEDGNPGLAQNWAASKTPGGNPGSGEDPVFAATTVRINEVNPSDGNEDWVEFYNAGSAPVDISGWELVGKKRGKSVLLPKGSVVPAGGYLVIEQKDLGDLLLMRRGESLYLREMVNGTWTNSETGLEYPASPKSTAGIIELSDGTWAQGALATNSKGKANIGSLLAGPIYINEIFYNPPEGQFEFLELVNDSDADVSLSNMVIGSTAAVPWEVSGLGEIKNISSAVIPAKGMALLMPDTIFSSTFKVDTTEYRKQLGLSEKVIFLIYSGKISNRGERLVVKQPYACNATEDGSMDCTYYWSDAVLYSDGGLWPKEADGAGMSLQRKSFAVAGSDPAAWIAQKPTEGKK